MEKKPSEKNIFGDRDETERKGANGCTKKAQQEHNARYHAQNYAQNKDKINDSLRKEYKGVFTKSDFAEVEGRKVNLKYYVDQRRSMRSAGEMVGRAYKQVCDNYERLCTENRSPAAMYAFFEYFEHGESFGVNPDFDRALKYLNMAADLGHAAAHMALANIYSDTHWRP